MDDKIMEIVFGAEGVEMEREKFHVTSLQSAAWCMAKASNAVAKIADAQAMKDEAIRRINAWFDDYTAEHNATVESMEFFLEPWVREEIKDKKSKSVKLPNGTAGYRTTPESVVITDEEKIVGEAKAAGVETHIKETVHKKDLKKHIMETGQVFDNAFLVPGSEKFYIKIKGK